MPAAVSVSLPKWFSSTVASEGAAPRSAFALLVFLGVSKAISVILAYWYFSVMIQDWIVNDRLTTQAPLLAMSVCLLGAWLLQRVRIHQTEHAKASLLASLERRLITQFGCQQHALIRQQSTYYWQSLWLQHLPAIADWHCEYRVQQSIAALVPLLVLAVIGWMNPVIGIALLIALPVVPLFMIVVGKGAARLHQRHFKAFERLGGMFVDRLKALPMLATFSAYERQKALLGRASEQLNDATMRVVTVAFLSNTVLDFFATLCVALVAVFIGFTLLGEIQVGPAIDLLTGLWILLTVPLLLSEMKALGQIYHQKALAQSACEALGDLVSEPGDCLTSRPAGSFRGEHFADFSVMSPTLNAPSLSVSEGDWIRLEGNSGAGKTVLLEALAGQREASHRLNCQYVYLSQQVALLPGTLRDNLCLDDHYADDTLWQVLAQVQLTPWARRLKQQLDTPFGEHPPLSGGEAQRLAIARLLLRDADVWLLDEPTAHLPQEQHVAIIDLLRVCCIHKTVIWASHKSLPECWFDRVWTVKDGEVLQQ